MHALNRHAAFTHGGGAAFDRAGADIPGGEDAGAARLQRAGCAGGIFPGGCGGDGVTGFDEASFVALDLGREPVGAGLGTDHGKDGRRLDGAPFVRLGVLQFHGFEDFAADHFADLGVRQDFDVLLRLASARKVTRHGRRQTFAADHQQHFRGALGTGVTRTRKAKLLPT